MNKKRDLRNAGKSIMVIISMFFFAYSFASDYFPFPSLGNWKPLGVLIAGAVFVGAIFWHLMDLRHEIDMRQSKLDAIQNTKPIIKIKKSYADFRDVIITTLRQREGDLIGYSTETGTFSRLAYESTESIGGTATYRRFPADDSRRIETYRFVHVVFINEPKEHFEYATAEKVWAEIVFCNSKKELIWNDIKGRWSETGQPVYQSPYQIKRDLLQVDFAPNQLGWELDIAMRNVKERIGFVFNNDNYDFVEFRRKDMELRDNKYFVKVILRGVRIKPPGEEFFFILHNEEEINGFNIEETASF